MKMVHIQAESSILSVDEKISQSIAEGRLIGIRDEFHRLKNSKDGEPYNSSVLSVTTSMFEEN